MLLLNQKLWIEATKLSFCKGGMTVCEIRKTDNIKDTEEKLRDRCIPLGSGWEIALGMLLSQCDYMELHGYGSGAYFTLVN